MARINIEDQLFKSQKFMRLVAALGDPDRALGRITRAYMVAQRYWFPSQSKIPEHVWQTEELGSELITLGIAERDQGGIYVHGTREQCEWLFQKQNAGKESAKARARQGQRPLTPVEHPPTSLLLSPSSSLIDHSSKTDANAPQDAFDVSLMDNPGLRAIVERGMAGRGMQKASDGYEKSAEIEIKVNREELLIIASRRAELLNTEEKLIPPEKAMKYFVFSTEIQLNEYIRETGDKGPWKVTELPNGRTKIQSLSLHNV